MVDPVQVGMGHRFLSLVPFTRVPFWVPIFDPHPSPFCGTPHLDQVDWLEFSHQLEEVLKECVPEAPQARSGSTRLFGTWVVQFGSVATLSLALRCLQPFCSRNPILIKPQQGEP